MPGPVARWRRVVARLRCQLRHAGTAGDDRAPPSAGQPEAGSHGDARGDADRRSTATPATTSRASGCRRCQQANRRPELHRRRVTSTSPTRSSWATACILALPHLGGWEWAGRWMTDQGHRLTVVVEPLDPPELFEWFADLRKDLGMTVVPTRPDRGADGAEGVARQRDRVPAVRSRPRAQRCGGRVLRRAHHAAGGPGDAGAARSARRSCRSACTSPPHYNGHHASGAAAAPDRSVTAAACATTSPASPRPWRTSSSSSSAVPPSSGTCSNPTGPATPATDELRPSPRTSDD